MLRGVARHPGGVRDLGRGQGGLHPDRVRHPVRGGRAVLRLLGRQVLDTGHMVTWSQIESSGHT